MKVKPSAQPPAGTATGLPPENEHSPKRQFADFVKIVERIVHLHEIDNLRIS